MKNKLSTCFQKIITYSSSLFIACALILTSSVGIAEDDMMGSMPKAQPSSQPSSMKNNSNDAIAQEHEKMKIEHAQMMKDHNKMMKKQSMAKTGNKQKMGTMKKKPMPMEDDMEQMDPMDADKSKKPADPMPAGGMDHM